MISRNIYPTAQVIPSLEKLSSSTFCASQRFCGFDVLISFLATGSPVAALEASKAPLYLFLEGTEYFDFGNTTIFESHLRDFDGKEAQRIGCYANDIGLIFKGFICKEREIV